MVVTVTERGEPLVWPQVAAGDPARELGPLAGPDVPTVHRSVSAAGDDPPRDAGGVQRGTETLTFTSDDGAHGCVAGDVMVWENVREENGELHARVVDDSCDRGLPDEVTLVWLGDQGP